MRFVRAKEPEAQPDTGRCSWWSDGEQCRYPGSCSLNTLGGGPWFCSGHFQEADQNVGAALVKQSQRDVAVPDYSLDTRRRGLVNAAIAELRSDSRALMSRDERREALAGIGRPKADPKRWARVIVARHASGHKVLDLSLAYAREALGIAVEEVPKQPDDAASERAAIQGEGAFA